MTGNVTIVSGRGGGIKKKEGDVYPSGRERGKQLRQPLKGRDGLSFRTIGARNLRLKGEGGEGGSFSLTEEKGEEVRSGSGLEIPQACWFAFCALSRGRRAQERGEQSW